MKGPNARSTTSIKIDCESHPHFRLIINPTINSMAFLPFYTNHAPYKLTFETLKTFESSPFQMCNMYIKRTSTYTCTIHNIFYLTLQNLNPINAHNKISLAIIIKLHFYNHDYIQHFYYFIIIIIILFYFFGVGGEFLPPDNKKEIQCNSYKGFLWKKEIAKQSCHISRQCFPKSPSLEIIVSWIMFCQNPRTVLLINLFPA